MGDPSARKGDLRGYSGGEICPAAAMAGAEGKRIKTPGAVA